MKRIIVAFVSLALVTATAQTRRSQTQSPATTAQPAPATTAQQPSTPQSTAQPTVPEAQRPPERGRAQFPREQQPQLSEQPEGEAAGGARRGPPPEEKSSVTHHTARIGGQAIAYTATAATYVIRDDAGNPKATMFYVAYVKDG